MKSTLTVTFLGTGTSQGVPVIGSDHPVCLSENKKDKRLRVSVLLQWEHTTVVIDCGPDFRQQMLREQVTQLDAVLLTHEHSDHVAGIDDIRPFYFRQGDISFYAEKHVFEALHQRFGYVFATEDKYPGAPTIKEELIEDVEPFEIAGQEIIPIRAHHNTLPVLGFKVGEFVYLTDVKTIETSEIEKIKHCEVLVVNALRKEKHHSHFNLDEALAFVQQVQPKTTYFTHISHLLGFHDEVEAQLPDHIHLAYDTLKINVLL